MASPTSPRGTMQDVDGKPKLILEMTPNIWVRETSTELNVEMSISPLPTDPVLPKPIAGSLSDRMEQHICDVIEIGE